MSGLTALTATPATAAGKCVKAQTKENTGVKITYSFCSNNDGEVLLHGTLYDTLDDRKRAYAEIKIGPWHSMMSTASSQTYSTGWQPSGKISVTVWRG
ncbi:hypothetical protein ABZ322_02705 [Streptomyces sp. NPDC006129]|uniref:hypothetical protein n=1 Tax=unclassified Streptomyces TaxID=2593676 RepID=UPI00333111EE